MVSIGARKRTLAGQTVYRNGSTDNSFGPPLFSLDSTFKQAKGLCFLKQNQLSTLVDLQKDPT
jgi:hypothetical protein